MRKGRANRSGYDNSRGDDLSYSTTTKCDLCDKEIRINSSGDAPSKKQKSFDLWFDRSGFDFDSDPEYEDINIDVCASCEPAMKEGLLRLIEYLKVEN
jgi:hypothetical protein